MTNSKFVLCALVLLLCISIQAFSASTQSTSTSTQHPFPKSLITAMAQREMRYHHYLWHNIRQNWYLFNQSTQNQIRALGWAPPRPARTFDAEGNEYPIPDNGSGEDFLYKHRTMIAQANEIIAQNEDPYGKITGWTTVPAPGDKEYPVPPVYNISGNSGLALYTTYRKTDSYYYNTIEPFEQWIKNPVNLRNMTLGELGARIETNIHSWMHMRFSNASSYGYRPAGKYFNSNFDKVWDNPSYNWLGDTYASHVHPVFWKLHGWIDDRIEDWRRAHNLSTIKWNATWTGGPMSSFASILVKEPSFRGSANATQAAQDPDAVGDVIEKVMQIVLNVGHDTGFGAIPNDDLSFMGSSKPEKH